MNRLGAQKGAGGKNRRPRRAPTPLPHVTDPKVLGSIFSDCPGAGFLKSPLSNFSGLRGAECLT